METINPKKLLGSINKTKPKTIGNQIPLTHPDGNQWYEHLDDCTLVGFRKLNFPKNPLVPSGTQHDKSGYLASDELEQTFRKSGVAPKVPQSTQEKAVPREVGRLPKVRSAKMKKCEAKKESKAQKEATGAAESQVRPILVKNGPCEQNKGGHNNPKYVKGNRKQVHFPDDICVVMNYAINKKTGGNRYEKGTNNFDDSAYMASDELEETFRESCVIAPNIPPPEVPAGPSGSAPSAQTGAKIAATGKTDGLPKLRFDKNGTYRKIPGSSRVKLVPSRLASTSQAGMPDVQSSLMTTTGEANGSSKLKYVKSDLSNALVTRRNIYPK